VSSSLSDSFHCFENRLIRSDIIMLRNIRDDHEVLEERCGGKEDHQGCPSQARGLVQVEFEFVSTDRTNLQ
jgi:hypothetical protein